MRVLGLDASLGPCSAAMVADGRIILERSCRDPRSAPSMLPGLVTSILAELRGGFDAVAVTVGPGSFTGLRAAIGFAHGLGLGARVPVVGVRVAEAIEAVLPVVLRPIWVVTDTRRGRVFLARAGKLDAFEWDELPVPGHPVALVGDAAVRAAALLRAGGADVLLPELDGPSAGGAGLIGERRLGSLLEPLKAQPVYLDPPEAKQPRPSRPAPV